MDHVYIQTLVSRWWAVWWIGGEGGLGGGIERERRRMPWRNIPDRGVPEVFPCTMRPLYDASIVWCIPWTMRPLEDASLVRCVSCTMCPLDDASLGRCVPWKMRPLDDASLGQYVPWMKRPWPMCPDLDRIYRLWIFTAAASRNFGVPHLTRHIALREGGSRGRRRGLQELASLFFLGRNQFDSWYLQLEYSRNCRLLIFLSCTYSMYELGYIKLYWLMGSTDRVGCDFFINTFKLCFIYRWYAPNDTIVSITGYSLLATRFTVREWPKRPPPPLQHSGVAISISEQPITVGWIF